MSVELSSLLPDCVVDDPDAPIEVDVTAVGVVHRFTGSADVELSDAEAAALRDGLALLSERGDPAAAGLLERWPAGDGDGREPHGSEVIGPIALRLSPAAGTSLVRLIGGGEVARQRDGSVLWSPEMTEGDILPWLLRLGPRAEILSPRRLRADLVDRATALAEEYRRTPMPLPPAAPPRD